MVLQSWPRDGTRPGERLTHHVCAPVRWTLLVFCLHDTSELPSKRLIVIATRRPTSTATSWTLELSKLKSEALAKTHQEVSWAHLENHNALKQRREMKTD